MSARVVPIWKCEGCGHRAEKLNPHGYCAACGSDAVTMDLGAAEVELARVMKDTTVDLNADQANVLLAAVTKVLDEWEGGGLRSITELELAALQELKGGLMGVSVRN